ncbi:MAG: hypothetical protein SVR94_18435, partial [Pseudomonadota bacterium]|nr:hypothetical protein [Pseudomonadota bacterium]
LNIAPNGKKFGKSNMKIIFLFISNLLLGCSIDNECFIADSITQIKTINIEGKKHFLYLRVAGMHEKEHFYELYEHIPEFDDCGQTTLMPLSEIHIDPTAGNINKLVVDNNKLSIIYSKNDTQIINFSNIYIEVK